MALQGRRVLAATATTHAATPTTRACNSSRIIKMTTWLASVHDLTAGPRHLTWPFFKSARGLLLRSGMASALTTSVMAIRPATRGPSRTATKVGRMPVTTALTMPPGSASASDAMPPPSFAQSSLSSLARLLLFCASGSALPWRLASFCEPSHPLATATSTAPSHFSTTTVLSSCPTCNRAPHSVC